MRGALLFALLFGASVAHTDQHALYSTKPYSPPPPPKLPNGGYEAHEVAFPPVADLNTLRISLERGPCFGECPVYKVEVRGDGSVFYHGEGFVAISGPHRAAISKAAVDKLLSAFRKARFFSLLDNYSAEITDGSQHTLSISFDEHAKTVVDYFGPEAGMPKIVTELENLTDTLAGSDRWIKGNAHSIAELKAEGWDFAGQDNEHQQMIVNAAHSADTQLFNAILDSGAKPK